MIVLLSELVCNVVYCSEQIFPVLNYFR